MHTLPGNEPSLVIEWCLVITWLLAAVQPKLTTASIRREQALGNLVPKHTRCLHLSITDVYDIVFYHIYTHPRTGISMVSVSSMWTVRQSLTFSFFSGINSSMLLTDRPGATISAVPDVVSSNTCRKWKRQQLPPVICVFITFCTTNIPCLPSMRNMVRWGRQISGTNLGFPRSSLC